jgi:hypothetical protein
MLKSFTARTVRQQMKAAARCHAQPAAAAADARCGRKPLLLVSYIGMAAALGAVAGLGLLPGERLGLLMVACLTAAVAMLCWVLAMDSSSAGGGGGAGPCFAGFSNG